MPPCQWRNDLVKPEAAQQSDIMRNCLQINKHTAKVENTTGSLNCCPQLHCISIGPIVTKTEGSRNLSVTALGFKMLHEMAKYSILSSARTQWLKML